MPRSAFAGTRIRERRMALGLRQSEVARRAGISGSYLNLIEHNRRRIGGKLLLDLAVVLKTDSASLAKGAASQMLNALRDAATEQPNANIDLKRTEDFADRFTDWAELILAQQSQIFALQQTIGHSLNRQYFGRAWQDGPKLAETFPSKRLSRQHPIGHSKPISCGLFGRRC
jgi:transcriptional regulator with XRE-family HTH domain